MPFRLMLTKQAASDLDDLQSRPDMEKNLKAVKKALGLLQTNLRHPSLATHKFNDLKGANGEDIFEAYAQNTTFAPFRIFWMYGPGQGIITIITISRHPTK